MEIRFVLAALLLMLLLSSSLDSNNCGCLGDDSDSDLEWESDSEYEVDDRWGWGEKAIKMKLIHRHSPELGEDAVPKCMKDRIKQLVRSDDERLNSISHKLGRRRMSLEVAGAGAGANGTISPNVVGLPMRSASDIGVGQYLVSFRVGSPPKKFILIADTGSGLTWMKCVYKCKLCSKQRRPGERVFNASMSSTFVPIPCSSQVCQRDLASSFSLKNCPYPMVPCTYEYHYADGTKAYGMFANDTVKIRLSNGQKIKLTDVVIGCTEVIEGKFRETDGVMGLGFDSHTFAIKAAKQFGDKFSYCLVDHLTTSNVVNYLVFGNATNHSLLNMQYTELLLGAADTFYAVVMSGISVDGKMLDIDPRLMWDIESGRGGTIIDSGSTLTFLMPRVFDQLIAALHDPLSRLKRVEKKDDSFPDYCFSEVGYRDSLIPKLAFHFADGPVFEPPVKSFVIDADVGVKCLGFRIAETKGPNVIGNILQQNHLWEFDLLNAKLGFAPSTCTL